MTMKSPRSSLFKDASIERHRFDFPLSDKLFKNTSYSWLWSLNPLLSFEDSTQGFSSPRRKLSPECKDLASKRFPELWGSLVFWSFRASFQSFEAMLSICRLPSVEGSSREFKDFESRVFTRSFFFEFPELFQEIQSFMNDFGVISIIHLPWFIGI